LPLVVSRKLTYLAKAEYFDTWRTAWFFRSAGQIPSAAAVATPPSARSTPPPRSWAASCWASTPRDAGL